jgi:hypothetical protein
VVDRAWQNVAKRRTVVTGRTQRALKGVGTSYVFVEAVCADAVVDVHGRQLGVAGILGTRTAFKSPVIAQ